MKDRSELNELAIVKSAKNGHLEIRGFDNERRFTVIHSDGYFEKDFLVN